MNAPRLVIRHHNPRLRRLRLLLGALALTALAWAVFTAGRLQGGADLEAVAATRALLAETEAANRSLRERIALIERSGQVDGRAHDELRGSLVALNDEILQLREELAFYRGIVSPADARRGLRVHELKLEPTGTDGVWRYRLMLIQAMQHDREAQGTAHLVLVGAGADGPQRVPVVDGGLAYGFRYFQGFDGDILLPQGFTPSRVEVELAPRSERDARVEQTFDWPAASAVGG